jgi:hypothetical protein
MQHSIIQHSTIQYEDFIKTKKYEFYDNLSKRILVKEHNCNNIYGEINKNMVKLTYMPICISNFNLLDISNNIQQYKIYKLEDGTIFSLYWYNNKWCIATNNGIEVNKLSWIGKETYEEIIIKLFNMNNLTFDKLDKNIAYTFGFTYPLFHPFILSKERIWYIRHFNVQEQKEYSNCPFENIEPQIEITNKQLNELIIHNDKVMTEFISNNVSNETIEMGYYGFILTHGNLTYILPSEIYKVIKQLVYEGLRKDSNIVLSNENRQNYIAAKVAVLYPKYGYLFPSLTHKIKEINSKLDSLSCIITNKYKIKNAKFEETNPLHKSARLFVELLNHEKINDDDRMNYGFVRKYITNVDYLNTLLSFLIL